MNISTTLNDIASGSDLDAASSEALFDEIMGGRMSAVQIAAVLLALRTKGEVVEEVVGAARAMRSVSTKVSVDAAHLVDTCGTGGSGARKLFNVSTAAAIVAAAGGAHVAKHGNRAASSKSGSADVLEQAGVNIELTPEQVARCITELGVGFLFAPRHHAAMRFAGPVRQELGVRTIFNMLGPLTNPAGAKRQVLGVYSTAIQRAIAGASQRLGAEHVLVVHADGLDELQISGPSRIVEYKNDSITEYSIQPQDFGLTQQTDDKLHAASPAASLGLIQAAFEGTTNTAATDLVALNGGAALYAAGVTRSLEDGVSMGLDLILSGQAKEKLAELVQVTKAMGVS